MGYSKEAREMLALAKKINKAVKDHPGDSGAIADAVDIAIRLEEFMPVKAHEFSKAARQYAARKVLDAGYDTQAYLAYRRSLLFDAKTDFDSFAQYIEIDRAPERRFYLPRRHYLKPMIAGYQDILDKKLRLLTVSQPKRTGKSQTEILFTLLISGRKPENATLMEGAGDALVNSFYQGLLEYLAEGSEYLFYDVFPEAKIVQTNADIKIINLKTKSRFPTVMCRSIDATQVGLSEATNALVLDDCVTGREEAMNQKRLDEKWNILRGDVIGRAIEGTPIIATGTRYSLNDPIGKLQDEAMRLGWNYRAIEIPALDPVTDESNYEYIRDGKKVFTTEFFREQRSFLSAEQWESEFQQRPIEVKGMLFPRDSLKRYIGLPVREPDAKITVCDPAESGSDFTCQLCLYIYGEDVYVTDVVYDSSVPAITKPECAKMIISHNIPQAVFESNSAGAYFGRDVGEIVKNAHVKTNIKLQLTTRNKETKIELASDGILKYFYFKDDSEIKHGSQYALFLRDLTRYVRGGKIDHDDAADCCAMCENEVRKLNFQNIRVADRIF